MVAVVYLRLGCYPMSHRRLKNFAAFCLGWWFAMAACVVWAEPAVSRKFNGPEKSWQLLNTGVPVQILAQEITPGGARDGAGFERIVVAAPAGQSALLVCPISRVAVLDELQARLWVNASRPDVQIAVRIVMPRSLDAQRRGPATAIVRGSVYNRPGHWQELHLADVPRLLADQVRVMRAMPGASIDPHEAFVDAVVLLVPGSSTAMELGTDDLEVDGIPLSPTAASSAQPTGKLVASKRKSRTPPGSGIVASGQQVVGVPDKVVSASKEATVRLQGTTLLVEGRAFLPRVIQWNGESLQFLANCGFNVVQLPAAPTPEQSADAQRYGLWFLCTPEHPDALARTGLGRADDRVLAWQLRDDALELDQNYSMRWAELVRERDTVFGRPVVITPQSNWGAVSKAADILIARHPRNGPLRPLEFEAWLEACPQKAQPGTPLWIGISTQADEAVQRQVSALTHVAAPPQCVDPQQLESSVQYACAHNARGFVFQSASSLSATDEPTQQRVVALSLINRRLQLIEPWLAGGKVVEQVPSSDGADTGVLLHVDRARLLIPLPSERGPQTKVKHDFGKPISNEVVFTVPGIPETSQMFYFSPAVMRTMDPQRIAGGTKITLPPTSGGYVLMTEDPQVIQSLQQRISRDGAKTVQLEHDLAVRCACASAYGTQRSAQLGFNAELAAREVATVDQQLAQSDSLLAAGQIEQAHNAVAVAVHQIERATAAQRIAAAVPAGLESNPLTTSSDTLPEFAALQRSISAPPSRREPFGWWRL